MDKVPETTAITVVLPTRGGSPHFDGALASVLAQSLRPAEIVVVCTGMVPMVGLASGGAAAVRVIAAPGVNLARALNIGLREARCPWVARMDDDDVSLPSRFAEQAAYLGEHSDVVVVGSAFERVDDAGRMIERCGVPCDPREVRWRMLVENCVAHGSVMMRKSAVMEAGGYDESCERAQDYDLWLRLLSQRGPVIANVPEVLYRYRCDASARDAAGWRPSAAQAGVAAGALLRAWAALPPGGGENDPELRQAMARVMAEPQGGAWIIERLLTERGPTRAGMHALAWARQVRAAVPMAALEAGRAALLREVGASMRAAGVERVWLWGAGKHTAWVLAHAGELGVRIVGIVDDFAHGTVAHGFEVAHPSELDDSCDVLLSSDTQEDAMWASSVSARARGVRVWRLYGRVDGVRTPRAAMGAAA
jgi:hypothetical protein